MEASGKPFRKDEVSFLRGNRYVFSYRHNRIEFWTSSFTGKEVVKVNGKVVSESRSYRKRVQHRLSIGGQRLVLEWRIDSLLKGPIFCTLYTEDRTGQLQPHARKQIFTTSRRNTSNSKNQALPLAVIEDVPLTPEYDDEAKPR